MPDLADPTIALQFKPAGSPGMANPFELMSQFANTQRALVETQTARQILAARQQAGRIISQSPDMDTALKGIAADPQTSGFVPEIMSTLQGVSASQTAQAGERQTQATSGLQTLIKNIAGAGIVDPGAIKSAADAALAVMSPTARAANSTAYGALVKSLTDGLDDPGMDPAARKSAFNQRLAGIGMATGAISADDIRALTGSVAPSVTMQPVGPNGEQVPVLAGSPNVTSPPSAQVMGQPGAPVQSLSPGAVGLQAQRAAVEGETSKEMATAANTIPGELRNVSLIRDALRAIRPGGGAKARGELAQSAQALKNAGFTGISDEAISMLANGQDGDIDGLPASQLLTKELSGISLSALRQAAQGLGKATAPEINMALDQTDLDKDPKMLSTLVDQMEYELNLQKDRSDKYFKEYSSDLKSGKADMGSYYEWYNHNHLDDFQGKFEKSHPRQIGQGAEGKNKKVLDSIFGP